MLTGERCRELMEESTECLKQCRANDSVAYSKDWINSYLRRLYWLENRLPSLIERDKMSQKIANQIVENARS